MGLNLSEEQRRLAFWRILSLDGLWEMVLSYGLAPENANLSTFIVTNVTRFLQRARETNKLKGKVNDLRRLAVTSILVGYVPTPKNPDGKAEDARRSH